MGFLIDIWQRLSCPICLVSFGPILPPPPCISRRLVIRQKWGNPLSMLYHLPDDDFKATTSLQLSTSLRSFYGLTSQAVKYTLWHPRLFFPSVLLLSFWCLSSILLRSAFFLVIVWHRSSFCHPSILLSFCTCLPFVFLLSCIYPATVLPLSSFCLAFILFLPSFRLATILFKSFFCFPSI